MKRIYYSILIMAVGIVIGYFITKSDLDRREALPVIQPRDVLPEMVDESVANRGLGHHIQRFSFQDQNDEIFTIDDVKGKIFVAEYFFTTCKTICPVMNDQMERVQEHFKDHPNFKILSFTVDPEIDDVPTMKAYSESRNANDEMWHFLTGPKEELYDLARKSFFVLKPAEVEKTGDGGSDFIHTNNFVLVDGQQRIRGYYDGTSKEEVDSLIIDIEFLMEG